MFFRKPGIRENRIENSGRWPVRLTHFQLVDDYEFPATNFPEIFLVQGGSFLHESEAGTQAVREGVAMLANPGVRHWVKQPTGAVLTRVRYLPEWFTRDYEIVVRSPEVLSLFFDQSWLHYPREELLHVFSTSGEGMARIRAELVALGELLRDGRDYEPVARVSMLKLMMLLGDERRRYWRGATEMEVVPEVARVLDHIESCILRAEPYDPASMPRGESDREAVEEAFSDLVGLSTVDYAFRRRVFHAAFRLLATDEEPRRIAKALGWPTVEELSRQFETVFDIPPAVYREKFGQVRSPGDE